MPTSRNSNQLAGSAYLRPRKHLPGHGAAWIRPSGSKLSQIFRLVISESSDQPELGDGNSLVDWDSVRFVDLLVDVVPTCSICLDNVVVPHMLQCGHCFCLPCIVLHLTSACNCCVCSEYARPGDLRSVRLQSITPVDTGSNRSFQLISMNRGVTLPVGSGEAFLPSQQTIGWWYSRVVTCSEVEVTRLHISERRRLEEIPPTPEEDGIHAFGPAQAVEFMDNRIASIPLPEVASPSNRCPDPGDGYVSIDINSLSMLPRPQFESGSIYCYQLVDGQHVYLEPVWLRALLLHFTGSPDSFDHIGLLPVSLNLPIVFSSSLTVDYETRKRYKMISHLPVGTPIQLCDVDLRGVVSLECLEALSGPISRRLQSIKKAKLQRKLDKRDVRKANAIPLSEEWGLSHLTYAPHVDVLPTAEDFEPLPSRFSPEEANPLIERTTSYARVAAELATTEGGFQDLSPRRLARNPEDALLAQYSRRPTERSSEIARAIDRAGEELTGPRPVKKKGVKLRIAG